MKTIEHKYKPLNLKIIIYLDPKDFANCEYKPFGEIPDNYWENYAGISDGTCVAFISKKDKCLCLFKEKDCSDKEILETIAHELGHLKPKLSLFLDEENKANAYEIFVKQVYEIFYIINSYKL